MKQSRNAKMVVGLFFGFSLLYTQCTNSQIKLPVNHTPTAIGLSYTSPVQNSVEAIYNNLISALKDNSAIGIVAQVNHQQNASEKGLDLLPTRVVMFGNPRLGTPLMQANQQAGLDLPQKILVYENTAGEAYAAFNSVQYLVSRHGLETASTLSTIENALSGLAKSATNSQVMPPDNSTVALNEGVKTLESSNSFSATYEKLRNAIAGNAKLHIIAELDHQQNARSVGLELNPTKLIVFGNPSLGTPLLQAGQTIGIDLPQKMLVYQDKSGAVKVAYNDPYFLAKRHDITGQDEILKQIATALHNLASAATK